MLAVGLYLVFTALCLYGVQSASRYLEEHFAVAKPVDCSYIYSAGEGLMTVNGESHICIRYGGLYVSLCSRVLLLSGDVELNPGPFQADDTQKILDAIATSNVNMASEIGAVRNDIRGVKDDLKGIKTELDSVKSNVIRIENRQMHYEAKLAEVDKRLENLEYYRDMANSDLECAAVQYSKVGDRVEYLEKQLNILESEKLKCSLRVFGLEETESESVSLHSLVVNNVLNVAEATDNLDETVIENVQRIGDRRNNRDKPRMVLVKFHNHDDKLKLFKYREKLRSKDIRVANDLTYNQRQQLKSVRERGLLGYFKNGTLYTMPQPEKNSGRQYRRGVRTLDDRNRERLQSTRGDNNTDNTAMDTPNNPDTANQQIPI